MPKVCPWIWCCKGFHTVSAGVYENGARFKKRGYHSSSAVLSSACGLIPLLCSSVVDLIDFVYATTLTQSALLLMILPDRPLQCIPFVSELPDRYRLWLRTLFLPYVRTWSTCLLPMLPVWYHLAAVLEHCHVCTSAPPWPAVDTGPLCLWPTLQNVSTPT